MRLNSVLKTCSLGGTSVEREPNASQMFDMGTGVREPLSLDPPRESGPVMGKSSDIGIGLQMPEFWERSGKVEIRGVSKSGRTHS